MNKNDILVIDENVRSIESLGGMIMLTENLKKKVENTKIAEKEKADYK